MDNIPYEVIPYSIENLKKLFTSDTTSNRSLIFNKLHCTYFEHYFSKLKARTIVIENEYIDRDFLEDYSAYYVRCFCDYHRKCKRLHFFSKKFTISDFENFLNGIVNRLDDNTLKKAYIGFIVIKPLPFTIVGRSCLKTYGADNNRRYYPIIRKYAVNLYGLNLSVETIAFQEQDRVVAACATSALWSIFQGTGKLFQHQIPSPVEITKLASKFPTEKRILPNEGLDGAQLIYAMRAVGLEPFRVNAIDEFNIKSNVYAYLKEGIPLLMAVQLYDLPTKRWLECHAVALTGYSMGHTKSKPYMPSGISLFASRIDKLYAHDDQVGPFARMIFDKHTFENENKDKYTHPIFKTSWKGSDNKIGSVVAVPLYLLAPLYHKIRIPFKNIRDIIIGFDQFMKSVFSFAPIKADKIKFEWDIYLTTNNNLKTDIYSIKTLDNQIRKQALITKMPRFIWRATVFNNKRMVFDLLFDATDLEQGRLFFHAITYNKSIAGILNKFCKAIIKVPSHPFASISHIIEWFAK